MDSALSAIAFQAGKTATLTNTLGPCSDYQAIWNIVGTGAIAIDDKAIRASRQVPFGTKMAFSGAVKYS